MAPQYKLTYFNLRALAEPSRLLLSAAKADWEDIRIEFPDWPALKPTTPWGKLPYLEDGKIKLSQSIAILRYLAKQLGYAGANEQENALLDEYVLSMNDFRQEISGFGSEKDPAKKEEKGKKLKEETRPFYLGKFNSILEKNGKFLSNNKLSYADIYVAHFIQSTLMADPEFLEGYQALKDHQETVFQFDGIKEWVSKRPVTQW